MLKVTKKTEITPPAPEIPRQNAGAQGWQPNLQSGKECAIKSAAKSVKRSRGYSQYTVACSVPHHSKH